jgi:hypothetical protein
MIKRLGIPPHQLMAASSMINVAATARLTGELATVQPGLGDHGAPHIIVTVHALVIRHAVACRVAIATAVVTLKRGVITGQLPGGKELRMQRPGPHRSDRRHKCQGKGAEPYSENTHTNP